MHCFIWIVQYYAASTRRLLELTQREALPATVDPKVLLVPTESITLLSADSDTSGVPPFCTPESSREWQTVQPCVKDYHKLQSAALSLEIHSFVWSMCTALSGDLCIGYQTLCLGNLWLTIVHR